MTDPVRAAIYCRLSTSPEGDTTKVEDQERICRQLCERRGWQVITGCGYPSPDGAYVDNNESAWKINRKRPGWEAMLTDVDSGLVGAIVVYHGDRLARRPQDLGRLIDLANSKGILLASPTGDRSLDNGDDRFILWIEAAAAERSSYDTSRRKKAQYERMRQQGLTRPGGRGGRAFGFAKDGVTHVPAEAEVIREAAGAIIGGQSVGSVLRDLTARGVRSTAGGVMSQSSFQRMLTLPRQAGLMPDGEQPAAWEPVLDRGTWETLRAVTEARPRNSRQGQGALYLLSGLASCGLCSHPMYIGYGGSRRYRCPQATGCGKVSRSRVMLDAYITGHVTGRLAKPENPAPQELPTPGLSAEFAALDRQRREIEEVLADHTRGRVTALVTRLDSLDRRLAELRELAAGDAASRLRARYAGITEEEFGGLPLTVRRSLVAACAGVTVMPVSVRGPGFNPDDVILTSR